MCVCVCVVGTWFTHCRGASGGCWNDREHRADCFSREYKQHADRSELTLSVSLSLSHTHTRAD